MEGIWKCSKLSIHFSYKSKTKEENKLTKKNHVEAKKLEKKKCSVPLLFLGLFEKTNS